MDFLVSGIFPLAIGVVGLAFAAVKIRQTRSEAKQIEHEIRDREAELLKSRALLDRSKDVDGLSAADREEVTQALARTVSDEAGTHVEYEVTIDDKLDLRDQTGSHTISGLTAESLAEIIRNALTEQTRVEREQQDKIDRADKRFQVWLSVGSFLAGVIATIGTTLIFAAIGIGG